MARYYEQRIDGRTIISTDRIEGARIVDAVNASCFREAKRELGYRLSDKDDDRLDQFLADRKTERSNKARRRN